MALSLRDVFRFGIDLRQRQEQMLGGDEIVFHGAGFALRGFEHLGQRRADADGCDFGRR